VTSPMPESLRWESGDVEKSFHAGATQTRPRGLGLFRSNFGDKTRGGEAAGQGSAVACVMERSSLSPAAQGRAAEGRSVAREIG